MATGYFGAKFGVRTLPVGLAKFGRTLGQAYGATPDPAAVAPACLCGAVALGRDLARHRLLDQVAPLPRSLLLVGAVLAVGCVFGHQNIG